MKDLEYSPNLNLLGWIGWLEGWNVADVTFLLLPVSQTPS